MKRLSLGAFALLAVLSAGCTTAAYENNHWHINSVGPRMSYHFLGYTRSIDGDMSERFAADADNFVLTVRRHLLNSNPENPFIPLPTPEPFRPMPPDVEFKVNHP